MTGKNDDIVAVFSEEQYKKLWELMRNEKAGITLRYRVSVDGRLSDPQGKFRDSLDQTLEVVYTDDSIPGDFEAVCDSMRDRLFEALADRGGHVYKVHEY